MTETASITETNETVPMDEVRLLERNPRKHPEVQIEALMSSIKQFGQYRPLVVDEEGVILAGNGLYMALTRLGRESVEVKRLSGLTRSQKDKLILADNRTGALSKDDFTIVDEMLRGLDDFEVPGYDPDVLRELLGSVEDVIETADNFGVLDTETTERLTGRSDALDEAREGVTTGTPPKPAEVVSDETKAASGQPEAAVCPTCRRAW